MPNFAMPNVGSSEQINALAQSTLADSMTVEVLRRMNNLFNFLAHGGGAIDAVTNDDQAREYIDLARLVIDRLRRFDSSD